MRGAEEQEEEVTANARGVRIWRGWPSPVDSFSVKYVVRRLVEKRDEEERGGRFEGR